ncbi:MAG: aminopeptidase, partial [Proteobacteria bacterium]
MPVSPLPAPRNDAHTRWTQLVRVARFDAAFVIRSPAFFVLLGLGVLNVLSALLHRGDRYGSPSWPVTRLMVEGLQGAFVLVPVLIAIYYGGELVWRDRDRRLHEIVDATAAPDWVHLLPKILAIALVLGACCIAGVLTGIGVQVARGYFHFDLAAYLLWFVLPTLVTCVQLAVLSVFLQVLVPQKYVGWALMLVYLVASMALSSAGYEHLLYSYASTPKVPLSDMNRAGRFWVAEAWLMVYWSAGATLLVLVAYLLWRRGSLVAWRPRLRQAARRLRGGARVALGLALAVFVTSGGWIFYNTNVLNRYRPAQARERRQADAEKALLAYETVPQPRIVAVVLDVAIYPKETRVVTHGSYRVENRTAAPIDVLHVGWHERLRLDTLEVPGGHLEQ